MQSSRRVELAGSLLVVASAAAIAPQCALPERKVDPSLECTGRLQDNCGEALTACTDSAECAPLEECLRGCEPSDPQCQLGCFRGTSLATPEARAFAECRQADCDSACCASCGGTEGVFGADDCSGCIAERCCTEASDCSNSSPCLDRIACVNGCNDPGCSDQCLAFEAAGDVDTRLYECALRQCSEQCTLGADYACVGDYDWPIPDEIEVTERFRVVDRFTDEPFEGLELSACRRSPPDCQTVVDRQTTDENGMATVIFPGRRGDFASSIEPFTGYLLITGDDFLPTLFYRDRPSYRVRNDIQSIPTSTQSRVLLGLVFALTHRPVDDRELSPDRGHAAGQVFDCHGLAQLPAPEITIEASTMDERTGIAYLDQDQLPNPAFTSTAPGVGRFVIADIPPAPDVQLIARRAADGEIVGQAEVEIRPGHFTIIGILPDTIR